MLRLKPYLTRLQMIQFALVFVHNMQLLFVEDCGYPKEHAYALMALATFFFVLFAQFYVKAYSGGDAGEKKGVSATKKMNGIVKGKDL